MRFVEPEYVASDLTDAVSVPQRAVRGRGWRSGSRGTVHLASLCESFR